MTVYQTESSLHQFVRAFCLMVLFAIGGLANGQGNEEVDEDDTANAGEVEEVRVVGRRARVITPLPGVDFDPSQLSINVQTATGEDILDSGAVSATQFLSEQLQSVTVADNAGNPFQQDIVFRGFSASPLIATPQGLSVYLDGSRVNEAFGDVVNWDLIPLNAIDGLVLLPGSNPLFGLNSLGGALSLTTKSGFSAPGLEASALMGSWDRNQIQFAAGTHNDWLGVFLSANRLREDGWRDRSPSELNQVFGRIDLVFDRAQLTASGLYVDNSLLGNGQIPFEDFKRRPEGVYTSPDGVDNRARHFWLQGRFDILDSLTFSGLAYFRNTKSDSINGDFWNDWNAATRGRVDACDPGGLNGVEDGIPGNPFLADGANTGDGPGIPGCIPNGVLGRGFADQNSRGYSLQLNWSTPRNELVIGATFDSSDMSFEQSEQLGDITANRNIVPDPDRPYPFDQDDLAAFVAFDDLVTFIIDTFPPVLHDPLIDALIAANGGVLPTRPSDRVGDLFAAIEFPVQRNRVTGENETIAAYWYDSLSILDNLILNFGGRFSHTRVKNMVKADRPIPLYQYSQDLIDRREDRCGVEDGDLNARFQCTDGDFEYTSFNPTVGLTWQPVEDQAVYFNLSRGSRTPSVVELACARDKEETDPDIFQGCTIPTSFTSDPFLEQVRSTTYEVGGRGRLFADTNWSAALYKTDLTDDILFVSLGIANRGVFDTFGRTRRQGVEFSFNDAAGRFRWNFNYSFVEATFESQATVINRSNSTSNVGLGELNEFVIRKGDLIPGVPKHILRASFDFDLTSKFTFGLEAIGQSTSFVRGNENNQHRPGGSDADGRVNRAYVGEGSIDGFIVFNFDAKFNVTDSAQVFLQVENILDNKFVTAGQLGLNSFTQSQNGARDASGFNFNSNDWTHSQFVGPGAPRAVFVGLLYSY